MSATMPGVGDRVKFGREWLQASGYDDLRHARGTITAFTTVGSFILATVAWDGNPNDYTVPSLVNLTNLALEAKP